MNPRSAFRGLPHRREFLYGLGATLGTVAFHALLHGEAAPATPQPAGPLVPRSPHHPAKAKACIFLFMEGGPSHIDTFDPKPRLHDLHMKEFVRRDPFASAMASGKRYYVRSPFRFRKVGQAGIALCEHFLHLAGVADELCVYRGCVAESIDHPTACYHLNTGNRFGGDPAVGAWITYGLGTESANLPAFVVLPEVAFPQGGTANWSNGFLPASYQGTPLRPSGAPILDLNPPAGVRAEQQRANLDLLAQLECRRLAQASPPQRPGGAHGSLRAGLSYAIRSPEPPRCPRRNRPDPVPVRHRSSGDRQLRPPLFAGRKLVQKGVRFVQIYASGWDSHDYLERSHAARIRAVDRPMAALIRDLRRLGLLDSTLVIWSGEFGRSPDNGLRGGATSAGRDHNAKAMSIWFAGGGVKAGQVIGATDELGDRAVEVVHPIKDLHATLLHLLGLNDNKLTYFHEGRFKQLSQTGGQIIKELMA